jgi:hypothetical protein
VRWCFARRLSQGHGSDSRLTSTAEQTSPSARAWTHLHSCTGQQVMTLSCSTRVISLTCKISRRIKAHCSSHHQGVMSQAVLQALIACQCSLWPLASLLARSRTHSCTPARTHPLTHSLTHASVCLCANACSITRMSNQHAHAHMHWCTHTRAHLHTRERAHGHAHSVAHTYHMHTYTQEVSTRRSIGSVSTLS